MDNNFGKAVGDFGMKKFIFFKCNPFYLGGGELYVAAKGKNLLKEGFEVYIFGYVENFGWYKIPEFQKFHVTSNPLLKQDPGQFSKEDLATIESFMLSHIEYQEGDECYIESGYSVSAPWAEYLAKRIGARHISVLYEENYIFPGSKYQKYMDFYRYKFSRKELYGTVDVLFQDESLRNQWIWGTEEGEVIQDIKAPLIENIQRAQDNIAYIGRMVKPYLPNIVRGMEMYAKKHPERDIQFLFVGNVGERAELICRRLLHYNNVRVFLLGDLVPIPKVLYEKLDVVIAGSKTACYSAAQGVPVIVADAKSYLGSGVLGYTCSYEESIVANPERKLQEFDVMLEEVLIDEEYKKYPFVCPPVIDYEAIFSKQMNRFREPFDQSYYDICSVNTDPLSNKLENSLRKMKGTADQKRVETFVEQLKLHKKKFVIFSAGDACKACMKWLQQTNICPDYIVDNSPFKQHTELDGCMIYPVEKLYEDQQEVLILLPDSRFTESMLAQIQDMNVVAETDYVTWEELEGQPRILQAR